MCSRNETDKTKKEKEKETIKRQKVEDIEPSKQQQQNVMIPQGHPRGTLSATGETTEKY